LVLRRTLRVLVGVTGVRPEQNKKKEDEICTSSFSSSTIPLTSGIEEAPQLLLSVVLFYHILVTVRKPPSDFLSLTHDMSAVVAHDMSAFSSER